MKAEELRIGNLVYKQGEIVKVRQIDKSIVDFEGYEPIPITEEILFKLGYSIDGRAEDKWYSQWVSKKYIHMVMYDRKKKKYFDRGLHEYVHQLQNSCFSQTRKELIYNPK